MPFEPWPEIVRLTLGHGANSCFELVQVLPSHAVERRGAQSIPFGGSWAALALLWDPLQTCIRREESRSSRCESGDFQVRTRHRPLACHSNGKLTTWVLP